MKANKSIGRFFTNLFIMVAGCAACFFSPSVSSATETVILTVSLNTISHGEFFLKRTADDPLLIRSEDLQQIGLKIAAEPVITLDSAAYISLTKMQGVTAVLDEKHLTLDLRADASRVDLPHVVRNYSPTTGTYVPSTVPSAFLNYRVDYGDGIYEKGDTWGATGQSGLRHGNLLLLGDGFYRKEQDKYTAVRLMTNLSWDRPESTSRWIAGDINADAGVPSGPILLGGFSYASAYSMVPGLITYPMGEFGGVATLPSEADIYVNGVLIRRERLAPGDYRFKNLPVSTGANNVEIVLRDSFGAERRSSTRFYFSDQLLKSGLHDYSYNIGLIRHDFGSASNDYGRPVFVSRHTFGVNDSLTVGAAAEAGNDLINLTPRVVIVLPRVGLLNILAGASSDRDRGRGTTLGVGYQLQTRYVNYHASLSHNSPEYRTLANQQATDTSHIDSSTGVSMGAPKFGTISLNSSFNESSSGLWTRSLAVSYSRSLTKNMQFSASVNRTWGSVDTVNFFTGMTFFPTNNLTASALLQTSQATNKETVYLQKSLPVGDGVGYRATFEREQSQNQTFIRTNPLLQVNSSYGSYTADLQGQFNQQNGSKSGYYQISAAGAVVYAGGHVGLSRPVSSSFAVVQVEGMANVAVLLDNQEVARTNANGMAYLPMLQPYQANKIAFKDNSIAANYLIKRYTATATPGLFGGECIYFPVATVQSYGGHLLAQSGLSLEYSKVTFRGMGREFSLTTLRGGEFYFENLVDTPYEAGKRPEACGEPSPYRLTVVPGMYVVTVVTDDSERHFNMLIPASDALFVPLGDFWLSDPPE